MLKLLRDPQSAGDLAAVLVARDPMVGERLGNGVAVRCAGATADLGFSEEPLRLVRQPCPVALLSAAASLDCTVADGRVWERDVLVGDLAAQYECATGCRFGGRGDSVGRCRAVCAQESPALSGGGSGHLVPSYFTGEIFLS